LAARGVLHSYVRPFVGFDGKWQRLTHLIPGANRLYRSTIGRRQLPAGLCANHLVQVGQAWDFLRALGLRTRFGISRASVWDHLLWLRDSALATKAGELAKHANLVVSASCIARHAFESVHRHGGLAILNFQMAHHRYFRRLLQEEIELQPAFASTIRPYLSLLPPDNTLDTEIELADHILVGSSFAKATFVGEGVPAAKISAISYGTDLYAFAPPSTHPSSSLFRILFVGQISQLKGISYLLDAYKKIKGPSTRLILAGKFIGVPEIFGRDRVDFEHVPHIPHSAVPQLLRNADVLVFPTLADGMGLVVLEAMASGLPVIITANGPGDLVRDGIDGFIVPIRDAVAIAERLELLRANPDVRMAMARAARLRAEQFGWDAYARQAADTVLSCSPGAIHPV
jgi:glycosyltransferase involved in cell wall biosynthesis